MSGFVVVALLLLAAPAFAGAGLAFAVSRGRELADGKIDPGMRAVAILLLTFAAICTFVSAGFTAIFAFGGIIAWSSYIFSAQRAGVFKVYAARDRRRADLLQQDALGR